MVEWETGWVVVGGDRGVRRRVSFDIRCRFLKVPKFRPFSTPAVEVDPDTLDSRANVEGEAGGEAGYLLGFGEGVVGCREAFRK